jgi:hypothetical protein
MTWAIVGISVIAIIVALYFVARDFARWLATG